MFSGLLHMMLWGATVLLALWGGYLLIMLCLASIGVLFSAIGVVWKAIRGIGESTL